MIVLDECWDGANETFYKAELIKVTLDSVPKDVAPIIITSDTRKIPIE